MDLPQEGEFKARLDGALSNLVWWKVSLPGRHGGLGPLEGWNKMTFKVRSYQKPAFDSMKSRGGITKKEKD